jgi:hypothetical protein
LIEAIACVVMLTIAIPPMLWAVRQAHVQRVNPVMASKARWLATEKLEDVIADRNSSTRGYDYLTTGNYPSESSITDFTGFARMVAFSETGPDLASAGSGYMTVTVTVSWTDAAATTQSLAVSTVLTEY